MDFLRDTTGTSVMFWAVQGNLPFSGGTVFDMNPQNTVEVGKVECAGPLLWPNHAITFLKTLFHHLKYRLYEDDKSKIFLRKLLTQVYLLFVLFI